MFILAPVSGAESPSTGTERAGASVSTTWALWDAEGQHLTTEDILAMRADFGAGIYFFREETRHGLDLVRLKTAGLITIKVAHPGYAPFKREEFLADEGAVRAWARDASDNASIDGIALDIEGPTATEHKDVLRWLSAEARARGKSVHAVPHFALFDRWAGTLTPEEFNALTDVVWPWLYNRFKQPDYGAGVIAMLTYWRDKGVTVPTYPIVDHGRESYSGITPDEAAAVPRRLREAGVESLCLFQPHASYRTRASTPAFASLWNGLALFRPDTAGR